MNREQEHPSDTRGNRLIITEVRGRIGKKDKARVEEFVYNILSYFNVAKRLKSETYLSISHMRLSMLNSLYSVRSISLKIVFTAKVTTNLIVS